LGQRPKSNGNGNIQPEGLRQIFYILVSALQALLGATPQAMLLKAFSLNQKQ